MMKLAAEDSVFNVFIFYQKWFFFFIPTQDYYESFIC